MTSRVFVYGTLKGGNEQRGLNLFDGAEFIQEAKTTSRVYSMFDLGAFPAVTLDGWYYVAGEVWEVTPEVFAELDLIEGYPDFYLRREVHTTAGTAWMYYQDRGYMTNVKFVEPDDDWVLTW